MNDTKLTREEFITKYTRGNTPTAALLAEHGRYAIPCTCDDQLCTGWQMGYPEEVEAYLAEVLS